MDLVAIGGQCTGFFVWPLVEVDDIFNFCIFASNTTNRFCRERRVVMWRGQFLSPLSSRLLAGGRTMWTAGWYLSRQFSDSRQVPRNSVFVIFQVAPCPHAPVGEDQGTVEEDSIFRLLFYLHMENYPLLRHHAPLPPPQWRRHLPLVQRLHRGLLNTQDQRDQSSSPQQPASP